MKIIRTFTDRLAREEPDAPGGAPSGGASPDPAPTPTPNPGAAPDFSFIPDDFEGDGAKFREGYDALVTEVAQMKEAAGTLPENPDAYAVAIPETVDFGDLDLPDDFKVELNADDPAVGDFQAWLHESRVSQEAVPGLMGVYAKMIARQTAEAMAAQQTAIEDLGGKATFDARMNTLSTTLKARLGDETAQELMGAIGTAGAVKALEKLLGPGSGTSPRTEPASQEIPDNVPPLERLKLANAQRMQGGRA